MKILVQWKDPDYDLVKGGEIRDLPDLEYERLHALGAGEYLVVEFDTEAMTATVVPNRFI